MADVNQTVTELWVEPQRVDVLGIVWRLGYSLV